MKTDRGSTPRRRAAPGRLRPAIESLESRLVLSAGNVLVSVGDPVSQGGIDLYTFTQAGQQVGSPVTVVPTTQAGVESFAVDRSGAIQLANGSRPTTLLTYVGGAVTSHPFMGNNLPSVLENAGGLATIGPYVFVTNGWQPSANGFPGDSAASSATTRRTSTPPASSRATPPPRTTGTASRSTT